MEYQLSQKQNMPVINAIHFELKDSASVQSNTLTISLPSQKQLNKECNKLYLF